MWAGAWARRYRRVRAGDGSGGELGNDPNDLFTLTFRIHMIEHMYEISNETSSGCGGVSTAWATGSPAFASGFAGPGFAGSGFGAFDAAFAQLSDAVSTMSERGVPADAAVLVALHAQLDALSALVCEAEIRFDRHELWRDAGASSLRAWFTDAYGLSRKEASRVARRAERLESWPEVVEAWGAGRLSGAQVDVVVAAVPTRFVSEFAMQAAEVVRVLQPLDSAQTEVAMRQWVRCAEASDGPEQFVDRPSGVHFDRLLDGRVALQGQLSQTEAEIVQAALRVFDVPDAVDERGELIGESRSLGKRNADALVEICRFALSHREGAGESGRFVPHVSLVVDIQELRAAALRGAGVSSHNDLEQQAKAFGWSAAERAWFADALVRQGDAMSHEGNVLEAAAAGMLACDSVVQRVLMADSKVLNLGREVRTATPAQRRAIVARDRHCRAPGCRTKPKHCDVHHIDHWINGGRTDVDRMVLLCGTHHREFHKPGYRMELSDQAEFTVHSPKGWSRSSVPERVEAPVFPRAKLLVSG
jgi:Domain of unknown function (DUF222)